MHLQTPPHEEAKIVRCVAGSVCDVVVDLRPGRPTQLRWLAVELTGERRNALFVPCGFAHGFLTLEDNCELEYFVSAAYEPAAAVGVRWDDPAIGIDWPFSPTVILERDATFADVDIARLRELGPAALG
jgi:dTDP-4-dehydrorhamnose 3,5-epimerase